VTSSKAIDVDLLMAPHHGSLSAKADRLMAWCRPETVVVSGSSRAISTRVTSAYTNNSEQLLITARDHAIRVEISADGQLHLRRWHHLDWVDVSD
jgi:competence protein ComEC